MGTILIGNIKGPQGSQGIQGPQGPVGPVGPTGPGADIYNGLDQTEAGVAGLDSYQGRVLDQKKLDVAKVANNLTTTGEGYALDARQGKALDEKKLNASDFVVVNNLNTTAAGRVLDARQGNVLNATRTFSLTAEQEYSVGMLGDKTLYRKYLHFSGVTAATNTEVLLSSQSIPSTAMHVSVNAQSMVKNGDLALPANSMYTLVYRTSRGLCFRQGFTSSGTWEFSLWIEYTKS